jgi:pimeloyl-ACP methyl ester carboxylesterase
VKISWGHRAVEIEWRWTTPAAIPAPKPAVTQDAPPRGLVPDSPREIERGQPLMVFLHEGLGSVSMWRDFPDQLCNALGLRGLVYSRPGYGNSTPRPPDERWQPDFMHRQAYEVLPAVLAALGIRPEDQPIYLFGHSDGGSISLLYAARYPESLAGVVVAAPHIMVEDITVESIQKAREAYLTTDLRQRLGRHHQDPDSAFWGWNDIWLAADFRNWSIAEALSTITCPVLAIQGEEDAYGTMAQIEGIAQEVRHAQLLKLSQCGHSPHKDQSQDVIAAVGDFLAIRRPERS